MSIIPAVSIDAWAVYSTFSALCMAVVSLLDKFVLTRWIRRPVVPVLFLGAIGLVPAVLVFCIRGFGPLPPFRFLLAFLAGVSFLVMAFFYFHAAKVEEISRVVPLFYLAPLFVSVFAAVFLQEVFSPRKYLGIFLLLSGAVLVSAKRSLPFRPGRAFWFMILAALAMSVYLTLTKFLLRLADFWTIFALTRLGMAVGLVPVFILCFSDLRQTVREQGWKVVGIMSLNEGLALVGGLLLTMAAAVGYVTLVTAVSSLQPFFVLIFATALSHFFPRIMKEEVSTASVSIKLAAIALMFLGAVLISR